MASRVQVILDSEERERFREQARREGLSLSSWLRTAGRERLAASTAKRKIRTTKELHAFFASCDARETGREPSWEEHLAVIERAIATTP